MNNLSNYIQEKLIINKDSTLKSWSDKELVDDYETVRDAYTKAEKKAIADKYGITDLRIRPIQIALLDILRENRKNKKEFTKDDLRNFFRYDIPETYNRLIKFLDQESIEFVEFMKQSYEELVDQNPRLKKYRYAPQLLSYSDRRKIKILDNLTKYLNEKYK